MKNRSDILRGKVLFLKDEAHRRLLPHEKPEKIGNRMWLIVQQDMRNETGQYTIILPISSGSSDSDTSAKIPPRIGLAKLPSYVDCSSPYAVHESDIRDVLPGNYYNVKGVMQAVNGALRLAMDLDPDKVLLGH